MFLCVHNTNLITATYEGRIHFWIFVRYEEISNQEPGIEQNSMIYHVIMTIVTRLKSMGLM